MTTTPLETLTFTRYQKFIIAILVFMQFTIILDFMILSPLGAMLMPALHITPSQFGFAVSIYAFSAGISGFLAAGFADRFDRKKFLLFFYFGFLVGTLLCGVATDYHFLLFARMVTGLFGGVIGSVVLAISADLFPLQMRGRVMGFLQTAFAASQILGIPAGLFLSNHWGWHAPFIMIVGLSSIVGTIILIYLKPVNEHLLIKSDKNAFYHLLATVSKPRYILAFANTALLTVGGFMLMPFGSAFTVHNMGIHIDRLPLLYLITGLCTIMIGPLVGKASDKFGKWKVFVFGAVMTILMVLIYTNLGITPLYLVILVNALLFMGIFSRAIPSQALTTAIPDPSSRGAFMAVSSSLQQVSGGIASIIAGLIVVQGENGTIQHFDTLGYILVGTTLISVVFMYYINQIVTHGKT